MIESTKGGREEKEIKFTNWADSDGKNSVS